MKSSDYAPKFGLYRESFTKPDVRVQVYRVRWNPLRKRHERVQDALIEDFWVATRRQFAGGFERGQIKDHAPNGYANAPRGIVRLNLPDWLSGAGEN